MKMEHIFSLLIIVGAVVGLLTVLCLMEGLLCLLEKIFPGLGDRMIKLICR